MNLWNVSNVHGLARTFSGASAFNGNIGNWNVVKVTSLFHTFSSASVFNQDISGWRPTNALRSLSNTFNGAAMFDQNLGNWNVSAVTNFDNMFAGTALSTANYEQLLIVWAAQDLVNTKTLDFGSVQYCSSASAAARASIMSDDDWTIMDGGRCTQPTISALTPDTMKTVTVAVGIQTSGVTVTATSYSPLDHAAIIAAADTTDPAALSQIDFQPRDQRSIVNEVNLLEEAIIDIEISNSAACTAIAPCEVTLSYTATDLTTLGITDPEDLSIFHYTGSQWEELASIVDTGAMTITAVTSSFSPFALATVITTQDTAPSFSENSIPDQTYIEGTAITALTLPAASGGNGNLTYRLAPLPPGLTFDETTRTISGIPTTAGTYPLTYTAADADANTDFRDSAILTFSISVESGDLTTERVKQLNEAIMPRLIQAMLANTVTAISSRIDSAFSDAQQSTSYQIDGVRFNSQSTLTASLQSALQKLPTYVRVPEEVGIDWRRMLTNSSFALSLDDNNNGETNTGISLWGSSDYGNLGGNDNDNDLDWDGAVFSIQLGADQRIRGDLLLGGLVSWSDGDVDLDFTDLGDEGSYKHRMTSLHPTWLGPVVTYRCGLAWAMARASLKSNWGVRNSAPTPASYRWQWAPRDD